MSNECFFKIPNDMDIINRLLQSIPSNWGWVEGLLVAPEEWFENGKVAQSLSYIIDDLYGVQLGVCKNNNKTKSELLDFMLGKKLAHCIEFKQAGYETRMPSLEDSITVASGLLNVGYRGGLSFYSNCVNNSKSDNRARCDMRFASWNGAPLLEEESGLQPARLHCVWFDGHRGSEEDIAPIVLTCKDLGLEEYEPRANHAA